MKSSSAVEPKRTPFRSLLSVAVLLLVGCGDAGPEPVTPGSSKPTGAASTSTPISSADPDTTTIDGEVMGVLDYPAFTFEAPITWSANGAFVTKGSQGVSVWDVGEVPQDPCHWQGTMSDPGPTVDDLVEALSTQRYRHATEPTEVTLSGYKGRFLELSVPDDWVVTGDADFEGCDVEPSNGHRDFVSWLGNGEGERYLLVAGQVELVWILDVDGQRLVIDAIYPPDTAEADRAELMSVVESLRFTDQAA
jgi:hypothetical protein